MTLETILRSEPKFVSVLSGTLRDSILEAAKALWPDFVHYTSRRQLELPIRREFDPELSDRYDDAGHFIPRWRRDRS